MLPNMGGPKTTADAPAPYVIGYSSIRSLAGLADTTGDPALKAAIRAIGVDMRFPRNVYPLETFVTLIRLVAAALYPDRPDAEALFETGKRDMLFYFAQTLLGRAVFRLIHMGGPHPTIRGLVRFTSSVTNLPPLRITAIGPHHVVLIAHTGLPPDYMRGVFYELLVQAGAQNPEITFTTTDTTLTYTLRW